MFKEGLFVARQNKEFAHKLLRDRIRAILAQKNYPLSPTETQAVNTYIDSLRFFYGTPDFKNFLEAKKGRQISFPEYLKEKIVYKILDVGAQFDIDLSDSPNLQPLIWFSDQAVTLENYLRHEIEHAAVEAVLALTNREIPAAKSLTDQDFRYSIESNFLRIATSKLLAEASMVGIITLLIKIILENGKGEALAPSLIFLIGSLVIGFILSSHASDEYTFNYEEIKAREAEVGNEPWYE